MLESPATMPSVAAATAPPPSSIADTLPMRPVPVSSEERIKFLDALRGFAVFGILLANIHVFSGYTWLSAERKAQLWSVKADQVSTFLMHFLVEGKFYSLFSFLFGLGFAIQMMRAQKRGVPFVPLFRRRLFILLLIGFAHAFFIWTGDILAVYAMTAFLLIPFRKRRDKTLLIWAGALLLFPILQYSLMVLGASMQPPSAPDPNAQAQRDNMMNWLINTMSTGSYFDILKVNTLGVLFRYMDLFYTSRFPKVLAMFLLGFYAGRREIFQNIHLHLDLARRVLWWGLGVGLTFNLLLAVLMETHDYYQTSPLGILQTFAYAIGVPALCLCYIAALTLLWQKPRGRKMLSLLTPVGRMALTNYLLQSVICVLIFYGYGLGYFGRVGAALALALAVGIFLVQIPLSALWLKYFRYGPVEWVWRQLTYRRRLPLRLDSKQPALP
jgi:uncharacterized protein